MTAPARRGSRLRGGFVNLLVVVGAVLVSLAIIELALRAWPTLLGPAFASGVLTRYTTREGGIYYRDPNLRMNFMIPGLRTSMYFNGYTWTHEADALGFRNRRIVTPSDVVVLGDSFIYGHGAELEDTVGAQLERILGRPVANLGRQGDCAWQEAYLLSTHIETYRPRHVVYFYSENDITDLSAYLSEAQMRAFIATPVDRIAYPPRMDVAAALRERERWLAQRPWYWRLKNRLYVVRAWRWLEWSQRTARRASSPATAVPAPAPATAAPAGRVPDARSAPAASPRPVIAEGDAQSIGWQYTRKAIAYMQYVAEGHGARLLVVPITPKNPRHHEIVRAIADERSLPFLDTSAMPGNPSLWLPGDSHFSPAGARRMAEMVAERLQKPGVVP